MTSVDDLKIPHEYDRRIKLDDTDRIRIRQLRNQDSKKWSYNALAREFGVSKSLIILVVNPDIAERKREAFKARRKDGRYYDKDKWREQMRKHRAWKREVGVERAQT